MRSVPFDAATARHDRNRGRRRLNLLGLVALTVGFCVSAAGCGSLPGQGSALPSLSSGSSVKTSGEAFKKKVEADSFPTASQAGV